MDAAIGTGTGGGNWSGATVRDLDGLTPVASSDSYDSFTVRATEGTTSRGTGTIVSTRSYLINSDTLTITNSYTLETATTFLKVVTTIKNESDREVSNLYFWTGTRDDYVGGTDSPTKERGNIVDGSFTAIASVGTRAKALRIKTVDEGVLFYSTNASANTAINTSLGFSSATNQDPATSSVGFSGDDSYALSFKLATSLAVGQTSEPVTWFYAAGTTAELDEVTGDVAEEAGADPDAAPASRTQELPALCAVPKVSGIMPTGGPSIGGTRITIEGENLTSSVYVANRIANVRISSSSKVVIISDSHPKGTATIRIDGCNTSASTTYLYDPDPVISSLSTSSISTSGGVITITGSFLSGASITIGTTRASITSNTDALISASLPAQAAGEKVMTLTTPFGSTTSKLTYLEPPSLKATLPSGYIAQGDLVSLSLSATGASSYSSSGTLPSGVSLNTATGLLSGIATKEGIYNFSITATNAAGSDTKNYTLDIDRPTPRPITTNLYFSHKNTSLTPANKASLDRLITRINSVAPRNLLATITMAGGAGNTRTSLAATRHNQIKAYLESQGIKIKSTTSATGSANKIEITAGWTR